MSALSPNTSEQHALKHCAAPRKPTHDFPPTRPDTARTAAVEAYRRAQSSSHHLADRDPIARQHSRKHHPKGSEGSHFEEARRKHRLSHSRSAASINGNASRCLDRSRSHHSSNTSAKVDHPEVPFPPTPSSDQMPLRSRPLRKAKSDHEMKRRKFVAQSWAPIISGVEIPRTDPKTYTDPFRDFPTPNSRSIDTQVPVRSSGAEAEPQVPTELTVGEGKSRHSHSTSFKSTLRSYKSFTNAFKKRPSHSITSIASPISYDASLPPFNFAHDNAPAVDVIEADEVTQPQKLQHDVPRHRVPSSIKSRFRKLFGRSDNGRSDVVLPAQHVPARQFHFNVNMPPDDHEESVPGVRYHMSDAMKICPTIDPPVRLVQNRENDENTSQFTSWTGGRSSYATSSRKSRHATSEESRRLYNALCDQIALKVEDTVPSPAKSTRSTATVVAREVKTYHLDHVPSRNPNVTGTARPSNEWRSWMSDQMSDLGVGLERDDLVLDLPKVRAQVQPVQTLPAQSATSSTSSRHRLRRLSSTLANRLRGASGQSDSNVTKAVPIEPPWADIVLPSRPHNRHTQVSSGQLSLFPVVSQVPVQIGSPILRRSSSSSERISLAGDTIYRFPESKASANNRIVPFEDQTLQRISQGPYAYSTPSPVRPHANLLGLDPGTPTKSTPTLSKPVSLSHFSNYSALSANSKENTAPTQQRYEQSKDMDNRTFRTIQSMRVLRERSSTRAMRGTREHSASPGQRMADEFLSRGGRGLRSQTSSPLLSGSSPRFI